MFSRPFVVTSRIGCGVRNATVLFNRRKFILVRYCGFALKLGNGRNNPRHGGFVFLIRQRLELGTPSASHILSPIGFHPLDNISFLVRSALGQTFKGLICGNSFPICHAHVFGVFSYQVFFLSCHGSNSFCGFPLLHLRDFEQRLVAERYRLVGHHRKL